MVCESQHGTDDNAALGDNTIIQSGNIVIHKP